MKVLIAGSNGMIGSALFDRLAAVGHEPVRLVRGKAADDEISWDPRPASSAVNLDAIEGFDAVIHMGGLSIAERRWTERQKEKLWNSRIVSSEVLTKALLEIVDRPKTFLCASAIGYYGNRGDEWLDETSGPGEGFLADLCQRWEQVTAPAHDAGIRTVNLRSGIVLAPQGGALRQQLVLFRLLMGGRLGDGRQYMSWISLEDEVEAIIHCLQTETVEGPVNLVSPNPVRNDEYTAALAHAVNRPAKVPSPRWMIAAGLGGQLTDEVLLASQRVEPRKLRDSGFRFNDRKIQKTLKRIADDDLQRRIAKKASSK